MRPFKLLINNYIQITVTAVAGYGSYAVVMKGTAVKYNETSCDGESATGGGLKMVDFCLGFGRFAFDLLGVKFFGVLIVVLLL